MNTSSQLQPSSPSKPFADPNPGATMDHDSTIRGIRAHLRRRSSRIERWVEEQHHIVSEPEGEDAEDSELSAGHPYLAYPHLSVPSLLVRDDKSIADIHPDENSTLDAKAFPTPDNEPSVPRKGSSTHRAANASRPSSPLRSLQLNLRSRRRLTSTPDAPRTPASFPTLPSDQDSSARHGRGSSLSTIYPQVQPLAPSTVYTPPRPHSSWRLKRRNVMGYFAASEAEAGSDAYQPRPSTSSSVTHSSTTTHTRTSLDTPTTPRKWDMGSIRAHSPSLWSLPIDASHLNDPPESTKVVAQDKDKSSTVRIPLALKAPIANMASHASVSSILGTPKSRKKRKLIVSGITLDDEVRFEAVKRWCESFGELNSISRAPSGDLYVDFRKAEIADTVCRLQARVYISGVGSVGLSWFTGKKP